MKIRINDQVIAEKLRLKIRLDFSAEEKSGRFLFGGKTNEVMADTVREQQINLLKNIPLQGVTIEDFDKNMDIYLVTEEYERKTREVAYAPLIITLKAENIEDILPFLLRPEFRKIELLGPDNINMNKTETERLLFSFAKLFQQKIKNYRRRE